MSVIFNETNINGVYDYSINKVQDVWIKEYINKFYGGEDIIIDTSTDDNIAYFEGELEWEDFENNTNNENIDSDLNLFEENQNILAELDDKYKYSSEYNLSLTQKKIEADKLGRRKTMF